MTAGNAGEERIVPMRLQRFLARAGVASRRGSENLMTAGRVTVNGTVVTELGSKVDPLVDEVAVDGKVVRLSDGHVYLMLNKPQGVISATEDPRQETVLRLLPEIRRTDLFPVGRLDTDTTGLLLFTTNGDLAHHLLHPSTHVWKHYVALVRGVPTAAQLERGLVVGDAERLHYLAGEPGDVRRRRHDVDPPRLEPREVEKVVDEPQ